MFAFNAALLTYIVQEQLHYWVQSLDTRLSRSYSSLSLLSPSATRATGTAAELVELVELFAEYIEADEQQKRKDNLVSECRLMVDIDFADENLELLQNDSLIDRLIAGFLN